LITNYHQHLRHTKDAVARWRAKRLAGELVEGEKAYYNRDWFLRMIQNLDQIEDRVRIERIRSRCEIRIGSPEHKAYSTWLGMLEVCCSLILYCDDQRYRELRDGDVELFHFPLSKWTRANLVSLRLDQGHINVRSRF
jgi:hypothetical protein